MGRALEPWAWASDGSGGAASRCVWTGCGCRLVARRAGREESWAAAGAPGAEAEAEEEDPPGGAPDGLDVDEGLFPMFWTGWG